MLQPRINKKYGPIAGWTNSTKFSDYIDENDVVLDYGCNDATLFNAISCKKKVGIETNAESAETAKSFGVEVYTCSEDVPNDYVDIIISNHALEHTEAPLDELKVLMKKLKRGGKAVFVIPSEAISLEYKPGDASNHLYTWSPMSLGNIFHEAGFTVIEAKSYMHKWPPLIQKFPNFFMGMGRAPFDLMCKLYAHLSRSYGQVRVIAQKP
ncbi:MAG: class I SAM-dependent methyltransferase [Burkholderiales bacterium]